MPRDTEIGQERRRRDVAVSGSMLNALAAKRERDARNAYVKATARYGVRPDRNLERKIARQRGIEGARDAA